MSDYDAMDFCGRDLAREIINAVRQQDLKVGIYHSMIDWHHPDYIAFDNTLPHPLKHERNKDKPLPVEGHDFNRYLDFLSAQVQNSPLTTGRWISSGGISRILRLRGTTGAPMRS